MEKKRNEGEEKGVQRDGNGNQSWGMRTQNRGEKAMPEETITIRPPKMDIATFGLRGTAPLVIHRFSQKSRLQIKGKMEAGTTPTTSRGNRAAVNMEELFKDARYYGDGGWEGCNAACFRNAMISACRLVNFKMTLAKLSLFVLADGWDVLEPQVPLVRIEGTAVRQEDVARVKTGDPYVTVRAAYHDWRMRLRVRYDADQFKPVDIASLLNRVGTQIGIGEGRPDSKKSAGMGWGLFEIESERKG